MFILQLATILLTTKLAGHLSVKFGQPSVLGELIIGIIIGPALLGWIYPSEAIHVMSEIGVLLLMFIAGLETDLTELNRNKKSSLAVATGGVILPLLGGSFIGVEMGMAFSHALFLGLLLSATSVSISVQTLKELGQLSTREGTTILGAAVVDDVITVVLLAFAMSYLGKSDQKLWFMAGEKIVFFASILLISWKLIPLFMNWLAKLRVAQPAITMALVVCFLYSYYAESLGITGIIGSFIAGIAVSQTKFKREINRKVEPIAYGVFVPIFFASIGLDVSFSGMFRQLGFILGVGALAIITKLIGSGIGAKITGFNIKSSLKIGSGMISRGEVALILATLGLQEHLFTKQYFTPFIIVIIITTLVTPPLLKLMFSQQKKVQNYNHK